MKNKIEITIEHKHHTEVVLTNQCGDTFTYNPIVHEGLEDFLSGAKILDIPDVVGQSEQLSDFLHWINENNLLNTSRSFDEIANDYLFR